MEKLTKKITHLLCKFAAGPKYEAACKWGIKLVTSEWIYECIKQVQSSYLLPFPCLSPLLHVCLSLVSSLDAIPPFPFHFL